MNLMESLAGRCDGRCEDEKKLQSTNREQSKPNQWKATETRNKGPTKQERGERGNLDGQRRKKAKKRARGRGKGGRMDDDDDERPRTLSRHDEMKRTRRKKDQKKATGCGGKRTKRREATTRGWLTNRQE
jgi:hypothetical protein